MGQIGTRGRRSGHFSVPGDAVFFPGHHPLQNRDCPGNPGVTGTNGHLNHTGQAVDGAGRWIGKLIEDWIFSNPPTSAAITS